MGVERAAFLAFYIFLMGVFMGVQFLSYLDIYGDKILYVYLYRLGRSFKGRNGAVQMMEVGRNGENGR